MAAPVFTAVPDRDTAPYYAALAEGRLKLQHCNDCARWTWPARPICSGCQGENMAWEPVAGTGSVHSWIVTHQPYAPSFVELIPYTIALVRLDEQDDILIPAPLAEGSGGEMYQGLRMCAITEKVADAVGQLTWKTDAEQ